MGKIKSLFIHSAVSVMAVLAVTCTAEADTGAMNIYGLSGLIDMPTGESRPDADFSTTISHFGGITHNTLSFQLTPRLAGSFRYSAINNCNCFGFGIYYDRSFDLHYQIANEGRYRPAIAIGLRDFVGTGRYSSEYLVATKSLSPKLKITAGIGWGRLGSYGSMRNPLSIFGSSFDTRGTAFGLGGVPTLDHWFRGPAAFFGGVEWQSPIKRLSLKAEYSSDSYDFEAGAPSMVAPRSPLFTRRSPFNIGVDYQLNRTTRLSAYYMYGDTLGAQLNFSLNPKTSAIRGSLEGAPVPIFRRPRGLEQGAELLADTSWLEQPDSRKILLNNLQISLEGDGFTIEAMALTGKSIDIRISNTVYGTTAQIIGRTARMMTRILPVSVEVFIITPMKEGLPLVTATVYRSDIEDLENDPEGAAKLFARTQLSSPTRIKGDVLRNAKVYPNFNWSIGPYSQTSFFDPDNPLRIDVGVRARARIEILPGLSVAGSVIKKVAGNLNEITRVSNSVLPHVRSDFAKYYKAGDPALEVLTVDYLFKVSPNIYGRISAGYLEQMYGGVSTEMLWKPVNSRFALGAELNLVRQRAYDLQFGFLPYQVATGHVSAYWEFKNGFTTQLDLGQYLAGDVGATIGIDRQFNNGWSVGAFFTLTNVSFKDFGEGSFDKGLRFTIPLSWVTGRPSQKSSDTVIRPITRDGGARLKLANRLYPKVRNHHAATLQPTWGRFWR